MRPQNGGASSSLDAGRKVSLQEPMLSLKMMDASCNVGKSESTRAHAILENDGGGASCNVGIASRQFGRGSIVHLADLVAAPHHIGQAAARVPPELVEKLLPVASHLNGSAGPHNLCRGGISKRVCVCVCVYICVCMCVCTCVCMCVCVGGWGGGYVWLV